MATLTFLGATREVTGSCYLIETAQTRLLMECGMFQGEGGDSKNERPFAFDIDAIDTVIVSHAHLDHSGLLPKLVREGYRGRVYVTRATRDLLDVMLRDAAYLQEKDAEWENKWRRRADKPLLNPLYTLADAEDAVSRCDPIAYQERTRVAEDVELRFLDAGHILGSAIIELRITEHGHTRTLVFTGDLGNGSAALLTPPERPAHADVVMLESTYGDRDHRPMDDTLRELKEILSAAAESGGNVLIPAFAVGRTQELLYRLGELHRAGDLKQRNVFLDSPMAIAATEIYDRYRRTHSVKSGHRPSLKRWLPGLKYTRTPEESMALNRITGGAIIIAGSGMCNGGRIRHHLKYNLWRPEAHVIIPGFQAERTPGRALVDGAKKLRLLGGEIAVKANIHTLGGFSAHAGQSQLIEWVRHFQNPRPRLYLIHGEQRKIQALSDVLHTELHWETSAPSPGERITL